MRLLALLAFSLPALAQFRVSDIAIYPSSNDVSTGQLQFLTRRADGKLVTIQAPTTATASYTLTLPSAAPASNGHCLTGTTAGVLSFAACPGVGAVLTTTNQEVEGYKYFGVAGADRLVMYRIADNQMGIQTMLDGQTDPTTYAYGGVNNQLLLQPREGVVGVGAIDTSFLFNVGGTFRATGAVTLGSTLAVAGTATISSHMLTTSPSTADIGDATNYFQTLNVENINAAPGGVAAAYTKVRKLEISDILGGTAFWDQRANATTVTSAWTLRDNGGSRALQAVRQEASSAANYVRVFGELRPAQRATADGDAVNDSAMPTLGNTSARWLSIWGDAATITNALSAGSATAGTITATTAFAGGTDGGTPIGSSSVRMGKIWGYDVDFAGTVKLGTSSTVGQVWTATGTDGSGDWATPATSPWVVSGSDLYYNTGNVAIGDTTTSIARLLARTSDVNVLAIHNSGTSSSTAGAGIQAAMESTPSSGDRLAFYSFGSFVSGTRYNGASVTAFTTQTWTLGSAQGTELRLETTANGAATRTASVVARASGATVAGSLGINTSTPAHALEVIGATAKVYSGTNTADTTLHIGNGDTGAPGQGAFLAFVASAATPYFSINALSQGVAWRDIALVNSGGSVCVGCTSPSAKLDVSGTFRATGAATFGNTSTFAGALAVGSTDLTTATLFSRAVDVNGLRIHNSGTPSPSGGAGIQAAIETAPASGDRLAFYAFGLRTGGTNYNGANITAFATQNWTPGSAQGTELRLETTANGAATRTASVVVNAAGLAVAGTATVSGITTFGGSLAASATDTHDIGSSSRFRNIYGQAVNAANIEVANGITVASFWRHNLNSASAYEISSGSASQLEVRLETLSSTNSGAGFRGTLYPLNVGGSNGDLGYSGTPWRTLYLSTGLRLTAGAAAGRVLTSNGSGDGTWEPLGACATCVTTNTNQTITGTKTFTASIAATTTDAYDIGSSTRFRNIYGQFVNTANLEIANGTTVTSFWRHRLNGASTYFLDSGSGGQTEMSIVVVSASNTQWGIRGTLYPLDVGSSNGDLGYSGTPWRTLYLSTSAFMNGTQWMDSSRNLTNLGTGTFSGAITANGGISTASGTNSTIFVGSGNFYIRTFSGGDASCSGVTNGWIGFRTDTNELQVCNGGATRKVAM
jgi:hypothetical protein